MSGRFKGASESEFALNLVVPLGLALGDKGRRVLRTLVLDRVLERGVGDWARQLSFGKLGAEDGDLGKKQFTFDTGCLGVVQHGPDGDEVFELTTGLLDDAVLALEDDAHSGQVSDFGLADHERVNVETSTGKDTGNARKNTRFILNKTVQSVSLEGLGAGRGSVVKNVGDGLFSRGGPRVLSDEMRQSSAVLVELVVEGAGAVVNGFWRGGSLCRGASCGCLL